MARIPQEERELIQNLCKEGKSFKEISKITGHDCKYTIPRICREAGLDSQCKTLETSIEQKNAICELRRQGLAYEKIAEHVGISALTIAKICKDEGANKPKKIKPVNDRKRRRLISSDENDRIIELRKQGLTCNEISDETGLSISYIQRYCKNQGINKPNIDEEQIRSLREQGFNYVEISEQTGIEYNRVGYICRRLNLCLTAAEKQKAKENADKKRSESNRKATIEWYKQRGLPIGEDAMSRLPVGLFYVGGFCNDNSDVEIACEKCGNSFFRKGQTVRKGMIKSCPICELFEREEREYIAEMDKLYEANCKAEEREERYLQKEQERNDNLEIRSCVICNKAFETTRFSLQICCSSECSKKRANRLSSHRSDNQ